MEEGSALGVTKSFPAAGVLMMSLDCHVSNRERIFQVRETSVRGLRDVKEGEGTATT